MSQAIKYESTTVEPEQSAAEIMRLVRAYGGIRFEMLWGDHGLRGVRFTIQTPQGQVPVRLQARVERVAEIIRQKKPYSSRMRRTEEQYRAWIEEELAYWIAWRQLRDFVEQALTGCPHGTYGELMERLEAMRDLSAPCRAFRSDRQAGAGAAGEWRVAGAGGAPAAAQSSAGTGLKMRTPHLTRHANGAIVAVELKNSSVAANRPRQTGGIFMPMFRGRRCGPGPRPKARRPVHWRVLNPRSTIGLRTRVAPVTAASGATGMSDPSPDNVVPFLAHLRPPSVREILATQDFDAHSAVDTAYELVDEISARNGGDVLLLALAIGCLCVEITKLEGERTTLQSHGPLRGRTVSE